MPIRVDYPSGMPCWIDCITTDPDAARAFYGTLFGWTFAPESAGYEIASCGGAIVGGLGVAPAGRGGPAFWTTYLASKDLDATAALITAHGGTVVLAPVPAGSAGRLLLALDPFGAAVGFWAGARPAGVVLTGEPGAMTWHELSTPSVAALGFYRRLFELDANNDAGRLDVRVGGRRAFGVRESATARWTPYFGTADVGASTDQALELRGELLARDGDVAVVADPAGAVFALCPVDRGEDAP